MKTGSLKAVKLVERSRLLRHKDPSLASTTRGLSDALLYDPNCASALIDIARVFDELELLDPALLYARRVLLLSPSSPDSRRLFDDIAQRYLAAIEEEHIRSIRSREVYSSVDPALVSGHRISVAIRSGHVLLGEHEARDDKAREFQARSHKHDNSDNPLAPFRDLSLALQYDPTCGGALTDLSARFATLNMHEPAYRYAQLAALLWPDSWIAWDHLAILGSGFAESIDDDAVREHRSREYTQFLVDDYVSLRLQMAPIQAGDVLIRVLKNPEHATNPLEHGELSFAASETYREMEDDSRRDADENKPYVEEITPPNEPVVEENEKKVYQAAGMTFVHDATSARGRFVIKDARITIGGMEALCCFSIVSQDEVAQFIRNYEGPKFGKYAVVITDVDVFNERVVQALALQHKKGVTHGRVTYVDTKAMDVLPAIFSPYLKKTSYQSEFEYRYSFSQSHPREEIRIGSIQDIAQAMDSSNLIGWVKERFKTC